jgi:hypothetical protein
MSGRDEGEAVDEDMRDKETSAAVAALRNASRELRHAAQKWWAGRLP